MLGQVRSGFLEHRQMKLMIRGPNVFSLQLVAIRREIQRHFLHVAGVDLAHELTVARFILARLRAIGGYKFPEHHAQENDGDPKKNGFRRGTGIHVDLT